MMYLDSIAKNPRITALSILTGMMLFLVIYLFMPTSALAQIIEPEEIGLDISSVQEDASYSVPKRIVVTPIQLEAKVPNLQGEQWFKGLYYYLIANGSARSGFTDIPFHYVVTSSGQIFRGNSGRDERKINIDGLGDDAVVVGYLADSRDVSFDVRAQVSLSNLLTDIANRNTINPSNIEVSGIKFVRDSEQQVARLEQADLFGAWQEGRQRLVDIVQEDYNPQPKRYPVSIQIEVSQEQVISGDTVTAAISITNNGDFGIYQGTDSEIIATKSDNSTSQFYVNNEWLSPSQFGIMDQGDIILPGQTQEFEVGLVTPLVFGELSETFIIENIAGTKAENGEFNLSLNIARPEGTIVEILDTSTGWLRLRSTPNGVENNEIGRVSSGQRFFQTENAGNGWIKIRLPDGSEGWVSRLYVRYL